MFHGSELSFRGPHAGSCAGGRHTGLAGGADTGLAVVGGMGLGDLNVVGGQLEVV